LYECTSYPFLIIGIKEELGMEQDDFEYYAVKKLEKYIWRLKW